MLTVAENKALEIVENLARQQADYHEKILDTLPLPVDERKETHHFELWKAARNTMLWCIQKRKSTPE